MTSDLPDWNRLRDLLEIHEAGSLSAAARKMGVSQSTMSRRLAAIEAGGRTVFLRDEGGGLRLTERGAVFVNAALQMRAAHAAMLQTFAATHAPLRIAACEVTAQLFVADALMEWAGQGRGLADLAVYDDLFALKPTEYDVLVTPADGPPKGLSGIRIGQIAWGLFAAPIYLERYPVAHQASALVGHRVIGASGSLAGIAVYGALRDMGGTISMFSSSPLAQREACARAQGIALLPTELGLGDSRLIPVGTHGFEPTSVWMFANAAEASHPRISAFLRWSRRRFRQETA